MVNNWSAGEIYGDIVALGVLWAGVEGCVGWGGICLDNTLCRHVALCSYRCRRDNERVFDQQDSTGVWIANEDAGVGGGVEDNDRVSEDRRDSILEMEVARGIGVVDEVESGEDASCICGVETGNHTSRTASAREEAVVLFSTRNYIVIITNHTPSSVEEGVVVEETAELC